MMVEGFLLGVIVTASLTAAAFFLKFWMRTRDRLFLAFAASFLIESVNRLSFLFDPSLREGSPVVYGVRFVALSLIVLAIASKNHRPRR